ncbi:NAD-dependent epimerase/dehydratase family protein [bacterium]|nr:NAD-dependent epimerase/dehydratase family protein [bacterium]
MKKVLIIGQNSYLASDFKLNSDSIYVEKIKRPFETNFEKYNEYDWIINFCIQQEHFNRLLSDDEMIDYNIAKYIKNDKTKFIFLSSRKVYGSCSELKIYSENSELKPFDFYSKNKCNIEQKLSETLNSNQLVILRTGNIIGKPSNKNSYSTFIGWLESELKTNGKITCTINKESKKDFITKDYFQETLTKIIETNLFGTYNVGAGFALTTKELLCSILPEKYIEYSPKETESEQFILNCTKINSYVRKFTQKELMDECKTLGKMLLN